MASPQAQPGSPEPVAVLIVDDDLGTREIGHAVLTLAGCHVDMAGTGVEALTMAESHVFDLLLVDLHLPDMLGTDLVRALRLKRSPLPFVLISAWLTTAVTVEAMKLGAHTVIEKPMTIEDLQRVVRSAVRGQPGRPVIDAASRGSRATDRPPHIQQGMPPRSAAERWAAHVLRACESAGDLKTLEAWASCAGVSYSSLCESCHLLGIQPRDARDLARLLRALIKSRIHRCDPEALLDVSDRRTLRVLLDRAGFSAAATARGVSLEVFLSHQRFVSSKNQGLSVLRTLLAGFV